MNTMVDNLTLLEARIEGLVQHLERALRANEKLSGRVRELEAEKDLLQERIAKLHGGLESNTDREDVIRGRLRSILERIDMIEQEIQTGEHPNGHDEE